MQSITQQHDYEPIATHHAILRRAQRHVAPEHEDLARDWGALIRQPGGRRVWHLGRKEAAHARGCGVDVPDAAIGVAVIEASNGVVITVLRSHNRRRLQRFGRRRETTRVVA